MVRESHCAARRGHGGGSSLMIASHASPVTVPANDVELFKCRHSSDSSRSISWISDRGRVRSRSHPRLAGLRFARRSFSFAKYR